MRAKEFTNVMAVFKRLQVKCWCTPTSVPPPPAPVHVKIVRLNSHDFEKSSSIFIEKCNQILS